MFVNAICGAMADLQKHVFITMKIFPKHYSGEKKYLILSNQKTNEYAA